MASTSISRSSNRDMNNYMDLLDDGQVLLHPNYTFKKSYGSQKPGTANSDGRDNGNSSGGNNNNDCEDDNINNNNSINKNDNNNNNNNNNNNEEEEEEGYSNSRSPPRTAQSQHSRSISRATSPAVKSFLECFESDLIEPEDAVDPETNSIDYTKYVGHGIREQVAEGVREWAKHADGEPSEAELPFSRCVVCTLPFGTCNHTKDWMNFKSPASRRQQEREAVERTMFDMDDVLNVASQNLNEELKKGIRTSALPLTHISHMHWTEVQCRAVDSIEGQHLDLSSPPCMGGSSGVMIPNPVGQPHLVVHGGIRYPRNGVFHAYSSTLIGSKQTAIYESRVFVFSMVEMTWHVPEHKGDPKDSPPGRYGHCAVVLPDRTMWTFGGRQRAGVVSDDVHIWNFDKATWTKVEFDRDIIRLPPPR